MVWQNLMKKESVLQNLFGCKAWVFKWNIICMFSWSCTRHSVDWSEPSHLNFIAEPYERSSWTSEVIFYQSGYNKGLAEVIKQNKNHGFVCILSNSTQTCFSFILILGFKTATEIARNCLLEQVRLTPLYYTTSICFVFNKGKNPMAKITL